MPKSKPTDDPHQTNLPLAEAEGTVAERRAMLGLALEAIECTNALATLCSVLFDLTSGGARSVAVMHEELGQRPWRLCTSARGVREQVGRLKLTGIVVVRPTATKGGFNSVSEFAFDWERVKTLAASAAGRRTSAAGRRTSAAGRRTSAAFSDGAKGGGEGGSSGFAQAIPNQESSPSSSVPPSAAQCDGKRQMADVRQKAADWQEAARRLRDAGLRATAAAIQEARERGLSAGDLAGLAEHLLANAGAWGPGAIFHAIREWLPGDSPSKESLWPTRTAAVETW